MDKAPHYGKKNRIYIIDAIRGLMILLMVVYHFHYDMWALGVSGSGFIKNPAIEVAQYIVSSLFIFTSGISCRLSRNNLKRGLMMFGAGMIVTLVTYVMDPSYFVRFGILHFLGCAALIFQFYRPLGDKINRRIQPFLYVGLYVLCYVLLNGRRFDFNWLSFLGFCGKNYMSSDYFPILPHIFTYLTGTWLGLYISEGKFPDWFYKLKLKPLSFVGRNTIWVYLLHQPVCYGIAYLMYLF